MDERQCDVRSCGDTAVIFDGVHYLCLEHHLREQDGGTVTGRAPLSGPSVIEVEHDPERPTWGSGRAIPS